MKLLQLKKAQAALEFLTTYGWAFLVILIMIGTLAYFGILSPSKILPNRCNIGPEFQCLDYQIKAVPAADDVFRLRLKNGVGQLIDVQSMTIAREDGSTYPAACAISPAMPFSSWVSAGVQDFTWTGVGCTFNDQAAGQKGKVLVTITYRLSGSTYDRQVAGEIFSTATI